MSDQPLPGLPLPVLYELTMTGATRVSSGFRERGDVGEVDSLTLWRLKLFYLALRNISRKWAMPIRDWKAALTRFTIQFEDRLNNL